MSVVSDFLKVATNPPSFYLKSGTRLAGISRDSTKSPLYIQSGYVSIEDAYNFGVWLLKNFGERRHDGVCNKESCYYFSPENQT